MGFIGAPIYLSPLFYIIYFSIKYVRPTYLRATKEKKKPNGIQ